MSAKAIRCLGVLQLAVATVGSAQTGMRALFPDRPAGYVTDAAGVLAPDDVEALGRQIDALRSTTGAEIAVVTLPTIRDYAAVDVAVAIGRAWGVGARAEVGDPRRNTGLVILLVPRRAGDPTSGQIFIATGQGLEGIVTDAAAGRVRERMRPFLASGDYAEGLRTGVAELSDRITTGMTGGPAGALGPGREGNAGRTRLIATFAFVMVVAVVLLFIGAIVGKTTMAPVRRRRRRHHPGWWIGGGGFGGFGGSGGGFGGGGFGGFGGGGGFSGGGAGGRF